eukprot:CAMPEP_0183343852 /NCGR_PEP_ID=MMETSP0164_2-20130417/9670_1 /TAXON_ID=221442 /ORGANISM="Coccolithus pelagicus ssp braarudi, Strain PLY182g" /LENGTH=323 /DNA_ID=CAMNT_0025514755 /DNA_START=1 /DNA_END=969 /DNA_ORIENTATION=-
MATRRSQYDEISKLGQGSFAVVMKVKHRDSGEEYAMKVMEKRRIMGQLGLGAGLGRAEEEVQRKVLSEARILKNLDHPNVIKFHEIIEDEDELLLIMELVEGGELFDRVNKKGPFDEAAARGVMRQLLKALEYLHSQNIVHRDLKLENILLVESSDPTAELQVKIADFGLAKLIGGGKMTSTFCGTPQYFAPEVLESRNSARGYDAACDMWSLGVILYILLVGYAPFDENRPRWDDRSAPVPSIFDQIRRGVRAEHFREEDWKRISPAARHLVMMLLVLNPQHRLTGVKALQHPWMLGASEVSEPADEDISDCSDGEEPLERL